MDLGNNIKVKKAVVVVDAEKLAAENPELGRLFNIVNDAIDEIQSLVSIIDANVKATFEAGIEEKDATKCQFALGGIGILGALGNDIMQHTQKCMEAALPEMIQNGLIDFENDGPEAAPEAPAEENPWNFGG